MKALAEVFSSGGGTQSCAIAALIIQGRLPKPDIAVIADTGFERGTTWAYQDAYVSPGLASVGVELHRVSRKEWAANWANGVFSPTSGSLLLPAFSSQGEEPGKMRNFCSKAWKTEMIERWISKTMGIKSGRQRRWIGFSVDELARAVRMMKSDDYKQGRVWFPLIEAVPMRRGDSIKVVAEVGWPEPPRSNCWMCPNQSDAEWLDLKENHPEEFAKAVALEKEIQEKDPMAWVHGSCQPLETVEFKSSGNSGACESGACFI